MRNLIFALLAVTAASGCGGGGKPGNPDGGNTSAVCGDGVVAGTEACDDGNTLSSDGCSSTCTVETGWGCKNGTDCVHSTCGDGVVSADETCDDGNAVSGDGCSSSCQLEGQDAAGNGWRCPTPGHACVRTVCGDHVIEGSEQCDDGNDTPFDGCFQCRKEAVCSTGGVYGACQNVCGDGMKAPDEECDDGNVQSGDGCSSTCTMETVPGVTCTTVTDELPAAIDVPVVYRDFKGNGESGGHPDFEHFHCSTDSTDLVQHTLGATGKPEYNKNTTSEYHCGTDGTNDGLMLTSADRFAQWYVDTDGVNKTVVGSLHLTRIGTTDVYEYDSVDSPIPAGSGGFFPLDANADGWGNTPGSSHDFGFTTEVRYAFTFQGGEELFFSGDDDVWVFINGKLALDLGGLHPRQQGSVTLDEVTAAELGLTQGHAYEMSLFHAERHTAASNFWLTLGGFVKATTHCASTCGDGIKAPDEECDDGNSVDDDSCTNACKLGVVIAR